MTRHIARIVDDGIPVAALQGSQVRVAVALEVLQLGKQAGVGLAAAPAVLGLNTVRTGE